MTFRVLSPSEAASMLGVAVATLTTWRSRNKGPRFVRVGTTKIGYLEEDLRAFVSSAPHSPRRAE
jgi:predicted DNA-binding transcriptional regulator AlpA